MQIVIKQMQRSMGYDPVVKILHPGKKDLEIRATVLNRIAAAGSDPMREVNAYLATLSEDRQLAIYDLYRLLCQERGKISHVAREIGKCIDRADVERWVGACLEKPEGIPYAFDQALFPDATPAEVYLQDQYVQLQAFGVVVKLLYPVMTLYGNNDFQATGVLRMAGVDQYPAYDRLRQYIDKIVLKTDAIMAKAVSGRVFDAVLYRRLPIADLDAFELMNPSLVAFLYRYASQRARAWASPASDLRNVNT